MHRLLQLVNTHTVTVNKTVLEHREQIRRQLNQHEVLTHDLHDLLRLGQSVVDQNRLIAFADYVVLVVEKFVNLLLEVQSSPERKSRRLTGLDLTHRLHFYFHLLIT